MSSSSTADQLGNQLGTSVIAPVASNPELANIPANSRPGNEISQYTNPDHLKPPFVDVFGYNPQYPTHAVNAGGFQTCGKQWER